MPDLVLYDGVCGLCNRFNRFILARDRREQFVFAPLQSSLAKAVLERHGRRATDLNTVYVVTGYGGPNEAAHDKGRAVLLVLRSLGGIWRLGGMLGWLPRRVLDAAYDLVAKRRYRFFGRSDVCPVLPPQQRARFLDVSSIEPSADG